MMVQINAEMESALKSMAAMDNRSPDEVINDLIAKEFDNWQEQPDPAILAELDRRHAALMESGMAIPWETARPWIESWMSDEELPEPKKCPIW
jgi:predicted transcriptional regulator